MGKIIKYEHHGVEVFVDEDLKGKHRGHSLCWKGCKRFHPEDREKNCCIANLIYALDVALGLTTPVWECSKFIEE